MENTYGTVIVANDINGDWDIQYKNTFDLVVLRHTLEHLLEPKKNLEQICQALTDNGYLYIEVPSLRNNQHLLFNDFFRPSHLSYFCKETLESLTRNAGLKPVILREEKGLGLWGLFKKGSTESIKPDVYGEMKRIIRERHSRVYSNDLKLLLKIKLLNLLRIAGVYEPSVRKQCC
jgi:SAM-dependent methyltransferase